MKYLRVTGSCCLLAGIALLTLCSLLYGCRNKYTAVSGTVIDAKTEEPLPNAVVHLGQYVQQTGPGGHFEFSKIQSGTYPFTVQKEGYDVYNTVLAISVDQHVVLKVTLSPLGQELEKLHEGANAPSSEVVQEEQRPEFGSGSQAQAVDVQTETPGSFVKVKGLVINPLQTIREEERTIVAFLIVKETEEQVTLPLNIPVSIIDDHGNSYESILDSSFNPDILNQLPKGFAYVEKIDFRIPQVANLETLVIEDVHMDIPPSQTDRQIPPGEFSSVRIMPGQSIKVGQWLIFSVKGMQYPWSLCIDIKNEEYNTLSADVVWGLQYEDGTIAPWRELVQEVAGLTSSEISVSVPFRFEGHRPHPRALFLKFEDVKTHMSVVRVIPQPMDVFLRYDVPDPLGRAWEAAGFSRVGFPVRECERISSGATGVTTKGLVQAFEKGHLYCIEEGSHKEIYSFTSGALDEFYWENHGGPKGRLGFPLSSGEARHVELSFGPDYRHGNKFVSRFDQHGRKKSLPMSSDIWDFEGGYIGNRRGRGGGLEAVLFEEYILSGQAEFSISGQSSFDPRVPPWSISGVIRLKSAAIESDFLVRISFAVVFKEVNVGINGYGSHIWLYYTRLADEGGIEYYPIAQKAEGICSMPISRSLEIGKEYLGVLVFPLPFDRNETIYFESMVAWPQHARIPFKLEKAHNKL